MASNGASRTPLYSADMVEEMRLYNSSLTPAGGGGGRQRPGRGLNGRGGSAINRGMGTGISSGRPAPVGTSRTHTGPTMLGNHVVSSAAFRGAHAPVTSRPTHASPRATSNPWSNAMLAGNDQSFSNAWSVGSVAGKTQQAPNSVLGFGSSSSAQTENVAMGTSVSAAGVSSQAPTAVPGSSVPPHLRGPSNTQPAANAWSSGVLTSNNTGCQTASTPTFDFSSLTGRSGEGATSGAPANSTSVFQNHTTFSTSAVPPHLRVPGNVSAGVNAAVGNRPGSTSFGVAPPPSTSSSSAATDQVKSPQPATVSNRERIVTNWGPEPVGPQIPAHLQQRSASQAIAEMAALLKIPYDELTADGVTIPAPSPRSASLQHRTTSGDAVMDIGVPHIQTNVGNAAWMQSATSKRRHTSSEMDIDEDSVASPSAGPTTSTGNQLHDSAWAGEKWNIPMKRPAPSEVAARAFSIRGGAIFGRLENSRPIVATAGFEEIGFASQSAAVSANHSAPLQSIQDGWPPYQAGTSAPLPHAHASYNANPLRQISNQFPGQAPVGSQKIVPASNTFAQAPKVFGNPVAPGTRQFSSGTAASPYAPSSIVAPAPYAEPRPRSNLQPGEKSLKDSMWA